METLEEINAFFETYPAELNWFMTLILQWQKPYDMLAWLVTQSR